MENNQESITAILKVKGKVVAVRRCLNELKMCAFDCQANKQNDYKVKIIKRELQENRHCMALYFLGKTCSYWIKVVENKLKVEETNQSSSPEPESDDYWFLTKNSGVGRKYSLCPLVAPSVWLTLPKKKERPYSFMLSSEHSPKHPLEAAPEAAEILIEEI